MYYVIENNRAAYYTARDSWMGTRRIVASILKTEKSLIESQLSELLERLGTSARRSIRPPVLPAKGEQTEEEKGEAERRERKQAEDSLQQELRNLRGLVFLDSVFATPDDGNDAMLVAEFSPEPQCVVFRVSLPKSARSEIPDKARLRVFGDVTRPLASDGYVDIRAIAVY